MWLVVVIIDILMENFNYVFLILKINIEIFLFYLVFKYNNNMY